MKEQVVNPFEHQTPSVERNISADKQTSPPQQLYSGGKLSQATLEYLLQSSQRQNNEILHSILRSLSSDKKLYVPKHSPYTVANMKEAASSENVSPVLNPFINGATSMSDPRQNSQSPMLKKEASGKRPVTASSIKSKAPPPPASFASRNSHRGSTGSENVPPSCSNGTPN